MNKTSFFCEKHLGHIKPFKSNLITYDITRPYAGYSLKQRDGLELDEFINKFEKRKIFVLSPHSFIYPMDDNNLHGLAKELNPRIHHCNG
ncbi:MAG: hypothetical protein ABIJ45_12990 [Candidatus Zixiibacteriota bacterium]